MNSLNTEIDGYLVNANIDIPDIRDRPYEPSLIQLKSKIDPPVNLPILDQGREGACVGFGLAAVINLLNQMRKNPVRVSPRMLYEMARRYDEWEGEDYSGSSCRGGIKGWHHMGVCSDRDWPYHASRSGRLTVARAKAARENTVGAYYRLRHRLPDFHAALNETHVIYASARVHEGWQSHQIRNGVIPFKKERIGGHAFAIVGYNEKGFWVQNSWGAGWGEGGLALWTYGDWQQNISDAWVLRLALPTPQVWHLPGPPDMGEAATSRRKPAPSRCEIAGHFVHIDDGHFHPTGRYWSDLADVKETAGLLRENEKGYKHLLFYAHGGLNPPVASARRIWAMKEVFKANGVYPYHFMYDTGLLEEVKDVIFGKRDRSTERVGDASDWSDWLIERLGRGAGRAIWRQMKGGASSAFKSGRAGTKTIEAFAQAVAAQPSDKRCQIHVVAHSNGSILAAALLSRLAKLKLIKRVASVSLLAPAATVDLYHDIYDPILHARPSRFGVDQMTIFNLKDRLERNDKVGPYCKSLLYLVSRSFEEDRDTPILGMERYSSELSLPDRLKIFYSEGAGDDPAETKSETHGGFDNDIPTMNLVLKNVLGRAPRRPFKKGDLDY